MGLNKSTASAKQSWGQKIRNQLLTWFGDIKVFRPLPFLPPLIPIYDPGSYRITARETRQLESLLRPGDILLRGYTNYLDGMLIPGFFSHAGLYLGSVTEADLNAAGHASSTQAGTGKGFATGTFMVAHSMAEGVFTEDLLGFCRADYLAVLRLPEKLSTTAGCPPYAYAPDETATAEALLQQKLLTSGADGIDYNATAWPVIRAQALSRLGANYDFGFDFRNFNDMSCTEYVHWCLRALQAAHGIAPVQHRYFMISKYMIAPDDLVAAPGGLEHLWASHSIPAQQLRKMGWRA